MNLEVEYVIILICQILNIEYSMIKEMNKLIIMKRKKLKKLKKMDNL